MVLEVVHGVMQALNRFKSSVSRKLSLWTGSMFVNRFNVYEPVQCLFGCAIKMHAPLSQIIVNRQVGIDMDLL